MKRSVYIETSIVSYYTARPSRDLVVAARQEITHEVWPLLHAQFDCHISALVIQEAARGDREAAAEKGSGKGVSTITHHIYCDQETGLLGRPAADRDRGPGKTVARELIARASLPAKARLDALHIALATLGGINKGPGSNIL